MPISQERPWATTARWRVASVLSSPRTTRLIKSTQNDTTAAAAAAAAVTSSPRAKGNNDFPDVDSNDNNQDDYDDTDVATVHTIDQAMRSLYSIDSQPTLWTALRQRQQQQQQLHNSHDHNSHTNNNNNNNDHVLVSPSSYVVTPEYDWILDAPVAAASAVTESYAWCEELQHGGDQRMRDIEEHVRQWMVICQQQQQTVSDDDESDSSSLAKEEDDLDDDDEFGEFQSAPAAAEPSSYGGGGDMTPSSSSFEKGGGVSPTRQLVEKAESILRRHHHVIQQQQQQQPPPPGSSEENSVATSELLRQVDIAVQQLGESMEPNEDLLSPQQQLVVRFHQKHHEDDDEDSGVLLPENNHQDSRVQHKSTNFHDEKDEDVDSLTSPPLPQKRSTDHDDSWSTPSAPGSSESPPPQTISLPITAVAVSSSVVPNHHHHHQINNPISLRLPWNEDMSPQGRFTRRRQQLALQQQQEDLTTSTAVLRLDTTNNNNNSATSSSSLDQFVPDHSIPAHYFTTHPDYLDHTTVQLLESLPWHYVLHDNINDHTDWALWDECMTNQLCAYDDALQRLQKRLLTAVQPHVHDMQRAAAYLQEWEQNMLLAELYWKRSVSALQAAAGGSDTDDNNNTGDNDDNAVGLNGPIVLLQAWKQRDEYRALQEVLDEVARVESRLQDLWQRIDLWHITSPNLEHDYQQAVAIAHELQQAVGGGSRLAQIHCLQEQRVLLGGIAVRFWNSLLLVCEQAVVTCCRNPESVDWKQQYNRLFHICLDLYAQDPESLTGTIGFTACWVKRLLEAFCYETDRSFAVALVDPMMMMNHRVPPDGQFQKELDQLASEVDFDWGDTAKLRTLTHNLVTIRFDFQAHDNFLPGVFQKLCEQLTQVLYAHYQFVQWHCGFGDSVETALPHDDGEISSSSTIQAPDVLPDLLESRSRLWHHCEGVIIRCLDEYLNFSVRGDIFKQPDNDAGTKCRWAQELDSLHQVLVILDRFLLLKASFFDDSTLSEGLAAKKGALYEKLCNVFRRHLRSVHVEAMNSLGRGLANETWILTGFDDVSPDRLGDSQYEPYVFLRRVMELAMGPRRKRSSRWHCATPLDVSSSNEFARFVVDGNPFRSEPGGLSTPPESVNEVDSEEPVTPQDSLIYESLLSLFEKFRAASRLAPRCVTVDLLEWFSKLLRIIRDLPLIAEDVSAVFANLCDLYFTTILRICAGSSINEGFLLGSTEPNPFDAAEEENPLSPLVSTAVQPNIFDPFRKGKRLSKSRTSQRRLAISSTLDAEICSPLLKDKEKIDGLRTFISRAQNSLKDFVNLEMVNTWIVDPEADTLEEEACEIARVFEKRLGAALSLYIAAGLADAANSLARATLAASPVRGDFSECLVPLHGYVSALLRVTPTLVSVANQISSQRAIGSVSLVRDIVGDGHGWEECKLNEDPNDYVDSLCEKCALVWGFLSASAKLPSNAMAEAWGALLTAAHQCLLEGFARVPYCSTEGRALMALDLACFNTGVRPRAIVDRLDRRFLATTPPPVKLDRGMNYVSTYIRAFYYPPADKVAWIQENYKIYKLNHALALVASGPERKMVAQLYNAKA